MTNYKVRNSAWFWFSGSKDEYIEYYRTGNVFFILEIQSVNEGSKNVINRDLNNGFISRSWLHWHSNLCILWFRSKMLILDLDTEKDERLFVVELRNKCVAHRNCSEKCKFRATIWSHIGSTIRRIRTGVLYYVHQFICFACLRCSARQLHCGLPTHKTMTIPIHVAEKRNLFIRQFNNNFFGKIFGHANNKRDTIIEALLRWEHAYMMFECKHDGAAMREDGKTNGKQCNEYFHLYARLIQSSHTIHSLN